MDNPLSSSVSSQMHDIIDICSTHMKVFLLAMLNDTLVKILAYSSCHKKKTSK